MARIGREGDKAKNLDDSPTPTPTKIQVEPNPFLLARIEGIFNMLTNLACIVLPTFSYFCLLLHLILHMRRTGQSATEYSLSL